MARTSDPSWPAIGPGGWASWQGPEEPPPEPVPWYAHRRLWLALAVATAVGYVIVGVVSTAHVYWEFHRRPTPWELYRAANQEVSDRWRTWPADKIFPDSVPYTSEQGGIEYARRVGIAPGTTCTAGVDAAPGAVLRRYGCRALLRATYIDQAQGVVMTFGVAALRDEQAAMTAKDALAPGDPANAGPFLHALPFPRTSAARFDDAARQFAATGQSGPYLVLTVAGQPDGRPAAAVPEKHISALVLAAEVGDNIADALALPVQPDCAQKRQWKC